jgi:hypothetical protein
VNSTPRTVPARRSRIEVCTRWTRRLASHGPDRTFHAPRPLAVWPHCTLPAHFPEDPEHWEFFNKGYLVGGGGKGGEALRKEFMACAYWSANLRTDTEGRLAATFKAPDSLTRYRVFAVAQTARHQFGSAEAGSCHKPLMLQPVPQPSPMCDLLFVRAVVQPHGRSRPDEVTLGQTTPRPSWSAPAHPVGRLRGADPFLNPPLPERRAASSRGPRRHGGFSAEFSGGPGVLARAFRGTGP